MERGREDFDLIEGALSGDEGAITAIVKKYQKMVFHISFAVLRDYHLAEDGAQETFMKAFAGLASLKKRSKFSFWLYRLAYNNAVNRFRLTKRGRMYIKDKDNGSALEELAVSKDSGGAQAAEARSTADVVNETISKLPEMYRLPVMLFYKQELSVREISKVLGLPVGTVKVRLLRARNILKEKLRRFL